MSRWADWYAANLSSGGFPLSDVANLYARAGQTDLALEWLERAFLGRDPNLPYIGVNPSFDCLHNEPRYRNLLRRMNFSEDVIAQILEEAA